MSWPGTLIYNCNMIDAKTLSRRVFLSRRDLNVNQEWVADHAGISRAYVSKIERGNASNVGTEVIFALARALGVSSAYLLGLTDDPLGAIDEEEDEEEAPATAAGWPPAVQRLAEVALELPASTVRALVALAEEYAERERQRDGNAMRDLLVEARRIHGDAFADQLVNLLGDTADAWLR